jgi:hypothetical protein
MFIRVCSVCALSSPSFSILWAALPLSLFDGYFNL